MNDFRTSMAALEIDTPQLCATQLVARPGSLPTLTFPMLDGVAPDVDGIWAYLSEPAEFFGVPMPRRAELAAAIAASPTSGPTCTTITIAETDGSPQILVSGTPVSPIRDVGVRVAGGDVAGGDVASGDVASGDVGASMPQATDPRWRRMAARTTSRGDADQLERWLNGRGYADAVAGDEPLLGALVFQTGGGVVGVENPEPTSVLEQLVRCGAIATIYRNDARPADAVRAWWISPRYETHPVLEIDGISFTGDITVAPPFTRWS